MPVVGWIAKSSFGALRRSLAIRSGQQELHYQLLSLLATMPHGFLEPFSFPLRTALVVVSRIQVHIAALYWPTPWLELVLLKAIRDPALKKIGYDIL